MYLMGLIVFMFWLARPQDNIYAIFAIELFFWATHNLNLFITDIPVSACTWEAMNISTLGWTVITMIIFNHRYVGEGNIKLEKFMLPFAIIGIGIFFLPDISSILHIGYSIWDGFVMVFGIYALYYLVHTYRQQKNLDAYLMMLVGIPILAFGLHDILLINNFIDRRDGLTMQYSVIPSVLLFSWFLIRRFVQSITEAERLAETLEQRVEEKQQALQTQYEQLNALEKKQVLAEERERIMRDMHDGIGGQLVSVITLLRNHDEPVFTKVREKVQHSLADLRLVIDSLDPLLSDLPTLLGMMRMRLLDQLESANIELEWAVTELPEIKNMGPRHSLHIMRIVQEAITNSIKHSSSATMTLATGIIDNEKVYIDIIDYGQSQSNNNTPSSTSRGINNMRYRAEQLGGELQIKHTETGTSVRLLLNI
jgi:signal transduction histidine kinase